MDAYNPSDEVLDNGEKSLSILEDARPLFNNVWTEKSTLE